MSIFNLPTWWSVLSASDPGAGSMVMAPLSKAELTTSMSSYLSSASYLGASTFLSTSLYKIQGNATKAYTEFLLSDVNDRSDVIAGHGSNDYIVARAGDDIVHGGKNNDILRGGSGIDLIVGGDTGDVTSLKDFASYSDSVSGIDVRLTGSVTVTGSDGHGGYDVLHNINHIIGSNGADYIAAQTSGNVNNILIGGDGADKIYGYDGNDTLFGGSGNDTIRGGTGDDFIIGGLGYDNIYGDAGRDIIKIDQTVLFEANGNYKAVRDFQVGPNGDKLDISELLIAKGFTGATALQDAIDAGVIRFQVETGGTKVRFDHDGWSGAAPQTFAWLNHDTSQALSLTDNIISTAQTILFAPVLGQSNAKGLSVNGGDKDSGISHLVDGLKSHTNYDRVVSLQQNVDASYVDIAEGGSTVDGNLNANFPTHKIWWYPDTQTAGETLIKAVDQLQTQLLDLRKEGAVKPVIIWGQGESEAADIGMAADPLAAVARYKQAVLAIFDYIQDRLGSDIDFYLMQTGRYVDQASHNRAIEDKGAAYNHDKQQITIDKIQNGLDLVREAQQDLASEFGHIKLAVNYADLTMLYEADPVKFATDYWHVNYDDREIIGDRLAEFIALDLGQTHVLTNAGPYPLHMLNDLDLKISTGVEAAGGIHQDIVVGSSGNDYLYGMEGDDVLLGGGGSDHLFGGAGQDTFYYDDDSLRDLAGSDVVHDFTVGAGGDILDISGLLDAAGYTGTDAVADGLVTFVQTGEDLVVSYNGSAGSQVVAVLQDVDNAQFSTEHNLIM